MLVCVLMTLFLEVFHIPSPELEGEDKDNYAVIGEKATYRLTQQPASFVVLKYVRQVVKEKETQVITTPPAPPAVFEKSVADVSFLAHNSLAHLSGEALLHARQERVKPLMEALKKYLEGIAGK